MELIKILKSLQSSRDGIETFLLFDGIGRRAVISTRAALEGREGDETRAAGRQTMPID